MADLSQKESAQTVTITGSNTLGNETYYMEVTSAGGIHSNLRDSAGSELGTSSNQINTKSLLVSGGQNRNQAVTTSASEALGAASILSGRKLLTITPVDGVVYWGYTNEVTSSSGSPLLKNQTLSLSASDNVHIYLITSSGTTNCRITEGS